MTRAGARLVRCGEAVKKADKASRTRTARVRSKRTVRKAAARQTDPSDQPLMASGTAEPSEAGRQTDLAAPPLTASGEAGPPEDGRRARRRRTEARLFAALESLLREGGVAALGVNALAQRSGVDKVLIYRYFGGLEGLMAEYAKGSQFWPTLAEILGADAGLLADPDRARAAARMLSNYARALRQRPVTLDLLAWECAHRNPLTVALESVREERSRELYLQLSAAGFPVHGGAAELSALLAAALNYLALRSREIKVFGGLALDGESAWRRIETIMTLAFRGVFAAHV
jgi:AcrR family transcriptional regulator